MITLTWHVILATNIPDFRQLLLPLLFCGLLTCHIAIGVPAFQAEETAWSRWAQKTGRWAADEETAGAGVWLV